MAATVEIVIGPARSGKTTVLLDRLRSYIAQVGANRSLRPAVWIAPTVRAARSIRERLLEDEFRCALGVSVVTFEQLARRVVESSLEEVRPISRTTQRRLLRRLVQDANRRGELAYFGPIAGTEGFLDIVVQFVRELKRREVWPENFRSVIANAPGSVKNQELVRLYAAYQEFLNRYRLYDDEGRFWIARSQLANGHRRPFVNCKVVVVDGFSDLTTTQHEIIEHFAAFVDHLAISLPNDFSGDDAASPGGRLSPREDLFSKARTTLEELCVRHPSARVTRQSASGSEWPALDYIERHLFRPPQAIAPPGAAAQASFQGIGVIREAGDMQELETIAGEIKRRILHDDARPEDILVVARTLGDRAAAIREVFEEFGIPISIEARRPIASTALVKGVVDLLRLMIRDWPFRDLLSIITNQAIPFGVGATENVGAQKVAAERVVRRLQIDRGRSSLLERVKHLAREADAPDSDSSDGAHASRAASADGGDLSPLVHDARIAAPYFHRLAASLDSLPVAATAGEWVIALDRLIRESGLFAPLEKVASPETAVEIAAANEMAWSLLSRGVSEVDAFSSSTNQDQPALDHAAILELILDVASHETLPPENDDIGRVRVLSAPSARAIRARHLYVIGLAEGSFPQPSTQERLFSDAEIAKFSQAGLRFDSRRDRAEEEMLLFYEVITRAESSLTLSYPGLDEKATPLPPSPYLTEFDRLCGDHATRVNHLDPSPINRRHPPSSPSEFRIRAVADAVALRSAKADVGRLAQLFARTSESPAAAAIDAGLRITESRSTGESFGPAEGIASAATAPALAERYGADHAWSTSQLEQYSFCPFQFYADRILKLEPLDGLALKTNYLRRGKLMHDVLAQFHARLRDVIADTPFTKTMGESDVLRGLHDDLNAIIDATPLGGIEAALRDLDARTAADWAAVYYRQHAQYDNSASEMDAPFVPSHFEVRFGPPRENDGPEDALSTDTPFRLDIGDGEIQIVGRIDRVDIGRIAGRVVFNVIDFKTGASAALTDEQITTGVKLQIPLYAMALEQHVLKDKNAVAWEADYWWLKDAGFGKKANQNRDTPKTFQVHALDDGEINPTDRWDKLRPRVIDAVRTIVEGVRAGAFPMHCADEHCTSRCDFRTVCRVGQVRALGKVWPPVIKSENSAGRDDNA